LKVGQKREVMKLKFYRRVFFEVREGCEDSGNVLGEEDFLVCDEELVVGL